MRQYPEIRPALFHPEARAAIRRFPKTARFALGKLIFDLQRGTHLGMPASRPTPSVAPGVHELRVRDPAGIYRVFYYLKLARGVLILHVFEKKTQKSPLVDINLAKKRLRDYLTTGDVL